MNQVLTLILTRIPLVHLAIQTTTTIIVPIPLEENLTLRILIKHRGPVE